MSKYTNDARWKRVRRRKLAEQPGCQRCDQPATDVHHIDGRGLAGPEGYAIENTESLCHSCHSKHTNATTYGGWRTKPRRREPERHPGLIDPPEAA